MDEEKLLKQMAELLLSKATMLQYHCADCKAPLFEKNGKIFCPRCGTFQVEKREAKNQEPKEKTQTEESPTQKVLVKKRAELLKRIEKEKNPKKISELLEALEKLERMLGRG